MSITLERRLGTLPGATPVLREDLLRRPDPSSDVMMTRRGWWLLVLNFLIPGSAQAAAGNRRLAKVGLGATLALWLVIVLGLVTLWLWPEAATKLGTNGFVLTVAQVLLIGYAVLWLVLTVNTVMLVRLVRVRPLARAGIAVLAIAGLIAASGGAAVAASYVGSARDLIVGVFGGDSAERVPPSNGYYNILLLGADSGEGRDSMRYDSLSVVSINADSGAVTITGIPRDMAHVPFSAGPMQDLYPDGHTGHSDANCGWTSAINQLRTEVEICRDGDALYPDAEAHGSEPGIEATKDAAEGVLGIEIPYYVFIDMDGFAAMINALGGVEIDVQTRLPEGGGPAYDGQPAAEWATGWIEPGVQRMDGETAQWYARSRYTTSDWDRMQRQRTLQQAILDQFTPQVVLTRFGDITAAGANLVQTDLPESFLSTLVDLGVKAKEQPVTTLELIPPDFEPDNPDFAHIQASLDALLHPPTPTPEQ